MTMKEQKKIAKNYARAIFELADDLNMQETFLNEIKLINESVSKLKNAKAVLESLLIPQGEKKELIKKTFAGKINPKVLNFLFLLVEKQRIKLLPEIQDELTKLVNKIKGIVIARVYSPHELD